jgi:beta-galactosidase
MKQILTLFLSLSILAHAFGQDRDFLNHLSDYIENTAVFQLGQEEGRAYHIPKQHLSLNGQWQFFYSETPAGIPADFFRNDFQADGWNAIPVPANWEMQGYGDKLFRNISTTFSLQRPANAPAALLAPFRERKKVVPFTVSPPEVPDEYNPAGAYRKTFTLPPDWAEQEVFLRFEKVASASFVWVNGQEVGYNEGAQEPSEYRITPFLREGENTVAVLVLKFSDGYYLEGQDYWRLAGIFDDVWLYATPSMRVFDWQVSTDLDTNYIDADLSVRVQVKNYGPAGKGYRLEAILRRDDQAVSRMRSKRFKPGAQSRESISLQTWVKNPDKWTAETPHLYDLSLQLWDRKGQLIDQVNTRIGFKETEVIGNTFFLNGTPIKLHGINSHMQHPKLGHVMDEATIRRDFEILKQFNFNSVRTSHYPPVNQYLELANEYGLYIIDEAGTEAHASEYLSEMPEYLPMYLDRVEKMVLRDRNHPSVLFWSAGNESGEGENISQIITAGKNLDPTRYWMYGGNADVHPSEEIIGPRYPSPIELEMDIGLARTTHAPPIWTNTSPSPVTAAADWTNSGG